jgi:hypothetical protein
MYHQMIRPAIPLIDLFASSSSVEISSLLIPGNRPKVRIAAQVSPPKIDSTPPSNYVPFLFYSSRANFLPLPSAVSRHKTAIERIVAGLFAMLGLTAGFAPERIARALHASIFRTLRPAESAVRRLIVLLAKGLKARPRQSCPMPAGLALSARGSCTPAFSLFDARPPIFRPRRAPRNARPQPRISFFGDGEVRTLTLAPEPKPAGDGLIISLHLARRLQALKAALDHLPNQARRLVSAIARREKTPNLRLQGPMRPGRPPGFRKRPVLEIDGILHQCDWMAREALPDTS